MERILKVAALEMKKKGFFKNVIINILAILPFLFLIPMIDKSIDVSSIFLRMIPYIIAISFCFSLAQEFTNKTDKVIFTGIFSRNEIIISKLISFAAINIIFFIVYEIVVVLFKGTVISDILNFKTLINNLYVFMLYAFTLGSFILLISAVTSNGILTGILTYVLYFDLILTFLSQTLISSKSDVVKWIIKNSPFYTANTGFYLLKYTLNQSIVMIISGCIFLAGACVVINRKSM